MCSAERGKRVAIGALRLVDPPSRRVISWERMQIAVELTRLLTQLGYRVEWWQVGDGWRAELIPGVSLWGCLPAETQFGTFPKASEAFHEQSGSADRVIYFDPILAYPNARGESIAVDHGVSWDDATFEASLHTEANRQEWRRRLWSAYNAPRVVVACETGVIQWANATWPGMQHRFVYIPHFVPPSDGGGRAQEGREVDDGPLRVLYPMRLVPEDGVSLAIHTMEELLAQGDAYRCYLSGEGSAEAQRFVAAWSERFGAHYRPQPLTEGLLAEVDVVVFPAKGGQSTSILCLQAMAAGKVVVVTPTGGLADVVLHDHTGLIIPPTTERLVRVLEELRQHPERRRYLGENARRVAVHFSLERWRVRWQRLLERTFG